MLPRSKLQDLLRPFDLALGPDQEDHLLTYLELLTRWNQKINLTSIQRAEECVPRHFGESLYLTRWVNLRGRLLDIGSGAGFPGLALKIACPDLSVTLLEPVAKKRAFLKEVARACQMQHVDVLGDRIEGFASSLGEARFEVATARAVGRIDSLVENASRCLKPRGLVCLWLGHGQTTHLMECKPSFQWRAPVPIPLSREREIMIGELTGGPHTAPE